MENKFKTPIEQLESYRDSQLIPEYKDIPEEFKNWNSKSKWNKAVSKWFFQGISKSDFTIKEGIDKNTAFRHLATVVSSWDLKHEHKEAGAAYLMSLWFNDVELN